MNFTNDELTAAGYRDYGEYKPTNANALWQKWVRDKEGRKAYALNLHVYDAKHWLDREIMAGVRFYFRGDPDNGWMNVEVERTQRFATLEDLADFLWDIYLLGPFGVDPHNRD